MFHNPLIKPIMNNYHLISRSLLAVLTAVAFMWATPSTAQNVAELEKTIESQEKSIKEKQDKIKDIEERISDLKGQIKTLEQEKKTLQKDVKTITETRKQNFANRDQQVYDQEVEDVLYSPYNREDVNEALQSFEGMETKEVIKRKKLIENYGDYTSNLREFLEKQKKELAKNKWAYQSSITDSYKKFEKGLKKTKYWKVYNKRDKAESINYLDRVMDKIMLFKNSGLNSETQFNEILNLLYTD